MIEKQKVALITGITGQDAGFLAEILLEKGYVVYGLVRRHSINNYSRITHIFDKIKLLEGDLTDENSINNAIKISQPTECYNLGAMSFVKESWNSPITTMNINALGCIRLLEAIRNFKPDCKYYQASSSEQFGGIKRFPMDENTNFYPKSPYGISKVAAYWSTVNYRESYGIFACNGILFNHESEKRGEEFVTRKISLGVAKIKLRLTQKIELGDISTKRDWGYAKDYMEAVYLILQQETPSDFVIATGETHSVQEFIEEAFSVVGITNWRDYIEISEKNKRPAEVNLLLGDYSKAKDMLGWKPKVNFKELVRIMVESDLNKLKCQ